jgi:glutathione S-transferase
MKLYGFPPSPNTWKVRAVAAYAGVPLTLEFVDLTKGQQRAPEYLALNPFGRTPTLVDGEFVLWESTAIMQYLAATAKSPLWPDDVRARADVTRWQSWEQQHWAKDACVPLISERLVKKILNLGAPDPAVVAKGTDAFNREARVLDAHLAKHRYLAGTELTLADFSTVAPLVYAKEAELPIEPYANVRNWLGRVLALPAWRDTTPDFAKAA